MRRGPSKYSGYRIDHARGLRLSEHAGQRCGAKGCDKTIIFVVTMPGCGIFCSNACAERTAKERGLWPK